MSFVRALSTYELSIVLKLFTRWRYKVQMQIAVDAPKMAIAVSLEVIIYS